MKKIKTKFADKECISMLYFDDLPMNTISLYFYDGIHLNVKKSKEY